MDKKDIFGNDYYVITKDFKLVAFNESVAKTYKGIKIGDYCYEATMKRDTPCLHCPVAGNTDCDCPIYYDPFYETWIEAIFSRIDGDKYSISCRKAKGRGMRVFDELGKEDNEELIKKMSGHAVNDVLLEMQLAKEMHSREMEELNIQLTERQKKLEEASCEQEAQIEEISDLNSRLSNQLSVIQTMSKAYFASFYINLQRNEFIEISNVEPVRKVIGTKGDAQKSLGMLCDFMVSDDTASELREFVDLSTVNERLKDRDTITCEYNGNMAGWCQLYMIAGERDSRGNVLTVLLASRTIHDEKIKEEESKRVIEDARDAANRANAAKTTFLFNMSHDIRTPMNAIMGFRDLLEKNQEDPEKRANYLSKIEDASVVLLSIINNVLEMARIEKGAVVLEETAWSVEQFLDTMYLVFCDMMVQKEITFSKKVNVTHNYVYCDSTKTREVFLNILSNAYKYTNPGGSVSFSVDEIPCEREGWAVLRSTISDTGIGMSEDFIPHIFDEFSREYSTTDIKIEGTGLGMPIVKRLIDLMGGNISVTSKKGVGTTFVVELPHRIATKADLVEHGGIELDPSIFVGKRVLLAEDNEINAEIATEILKSTGFSVDWVVDGAECLEKLVKAERGYYDIILMDVQMPRMNGYEATREIRAIPDSVKANIPILAMTANAFAEDRKEAIKSGMTGHVAKPIEVRMLMKELAAALA